MNNHFTFGNATNDSTPVYALYNPIVDCFFLVHTNLDTLKELVFLFSSKLTFKICLLNTSSNYNKDLIDNSVCANWTFSNKSDLLITRFPSIDEVLNIDRLVEKTNHQLPWKFKEIQSFLMHAVHWFDEHITNLLIMKDQLDTAVLGSRVNVDLAPGAPFYNKYQTAIDEIKQAIYLSYSVEQATINVEKAVAKL